MQKGSSITGTEGKHLSLIDSNGMNVYIDGTIRNFNTKKGSGDNVLIRTRNNDFTFEIQENGVIEDCVSGDAALMYVQGSDVTLNFKGILRNIETASSSTPVVFIAHTAGNGGTCTLTGTMENITGSGLYISKNTSELIIDGGTIRNCSGYAIKVENKGSRPVAQIKAGSIIEGNNNGKAQIVVATTNADNTYEHVEIAAGTILGNKTIDLSAFDVTLDENYTAVKLGNANSEAVTAINESVKEQYSDWTVAGSSAIWFQPSETSVHFTASRSYSVKNTGLFAAYIPLNEDGTPAEDAIVTVTEVENSDPIDVTLTGLTAGQSYAMMFVNNNEYTLTPDDITIYTGGGQGDETYDNGGFPKLTINGSVDLRYTGDLTSLEIKGESVTPTDDKTMLDQLLENIEAVYTYEDGTPAEDDSEPGVYKVTLQWKNGLTNEDVRVNGNNVKIGAPGTLIVRHTQDIEEAQKGTNTYKLLTEKPTEAVTNAVAIAQGSNPRFYTNDDTNREVDAAGIQILDDSLLKYEGEDRQGPMEEKAAEYLDAPGEGRAYRYKFHYLDLVDAYNGNAWVSAEYGTTVYLPYPEGVTADTAYALGVKVIHYKDLHREYGITGQENIEQAISDCEMETMENVEFTGVGIKFDVDRSGFSPFAIVWQTKAHTITATAGTGGSISPSGAVTVADGADKTFTITPNSGYEIADVKVDGISQGAIPSYTFPDVKANHSIAATFRQTGGGNQGGGSGGGGSHSDPTGNLTISLGGNGGNEDFIFTVIFTDEDGDELENDFYYNGDYTGTIGSGDEITLTGGDKIVIRNLPEGTRYEVIIETADGYTATSTGAEGVIRTSGNEAAFSVTPTVVLADPSVTGVTRWLNTTDHMAYLSGYPGGTFGPDNSMTRAEVAQMFYALLLNKDVTITKSFSDVPADAWYATAVNTLASLGMVSGDPDGAFRPNDPITRAEFCAIALAFAYEPENAVCYFTDVARTDWFYPYVAQAASYGWIGGYTDGSFGPNQQITRAQVTTIVNNMLGRVADRDYVIDHQNTLVQFNDLTRAHWAYFQIMEATNAHDYTKSNGTESWR